MKPVLEKLRKEYSSKGMDSPFLPDDPFELFREWMATAIEAELPEPNAMVLSTVSHLSRPSSRTVLLKGLDDKGLVFFTNYRSKKGNELSENPYACILFLWLELERQVRIEGKVDQVSNEESDNYFSIRPRNSQLGAWASPQSQVIANRDELERTFDSLELKYQGNDVPRPPQWGGYRLIPDYFEFWQGRENRMHDRIAYKTSENRSWVKTRLAP